MISLIIQDADTLQKVMQNKYLELTRSKVGMLS